MPSLQCAIASDSVLRVQADLARRTARAEFISHAHSTESRQRTTDKPHQFHRSHSDNVIPGSHPRPAQANRPISCLCSISWCPRLQGIYPPIEFLEAVALLTFGRTYSTCHSTMKVQRQFLAPRSQFSFSLGSPSQGSPLTIKCMYMVQPSPTVSVLQPRLTVGRPLEVHK